MILEYEKKQSVYAEKGCEHVVNGVIRFDDLIRTDYIPTNFSAESKNFLLRDGHTDWDKKHSDFENSVHLRSYDPIPSNWANNRIAKRWDGIRRVRQVVMSALENARNEGKIGASLQAALKVHVSADVEELFDGLDAASLFITSAAVITNDSAPEDAFKLDGINDVAIAFAMADGEKCARCWRITPEVTAEVDICKRCQKVVAAVR